MRHFAKIALLAATVCWLPPAEAAGISWPSFMWGEANNKPFLMELKNTFEKENPSDTVKDTLIPIATFWDKQFTDVSSGNPADIATMYDPEIRAYIEAGLLEPLDAYLQTAGVKPSEFIPTASLARKDGKIYAVPYQINARALFYNDKLLKDAGVAAAPRNVDEFIGAIRKMRKPEAQQFGFATISKPGAGALVYIELMPIITGFGGAFFKDGQPSANAPETLSALKFIKKLYDEQLIPRGMDTPTYRNFFARGKIGMYASGAFMAAVTHAANQDVYANLRAVPLPLPGGRSMSITVFLGVPKGAKHKDLAAKLLMRLLKDDQQQLAVLGTTVPGRVGMIPTSFVQQNPWFVAFQEAAKTAKSYAPEGAEQYGAEITKIVAEHIEGMLFNNVSADDTSNRLQKSLTDFIATKRKT
jgi:ABC-type glycerol-3-phosphate transport system substrate-binding protein